MTTGFAVPPLTPTIKAIMIACGAVWLTQIGLGLVSIGLGLVSIDLVRVFGVDAAHFLRGYVWQPFTYMWLHDPRDPFHLLFNMLFLWMFGGELERFWGGRAFLRYYLVTGVGAGLLIVAVGLLTGDSRPTLGASGAVYGVLAGFGIVFAERTVLFMMLFPMKARTLALVFGGIQLFYLFNQAGGGVSYVAHLGGAVIGFLYLKRAWRIGGLIRELRWRIARRRFKVIPPPDKDRWIH